MSELMRLVGRKDIEYGPCPVCGGEPRASGELFCGWESAEVWCVDCGHSRNLGTNHLGPGPFTNWPWRFKGTDDWHEGPIDWYGNSV